jgi:signal transduction histidine kinase
LCCPITSVSVFTPERPLKRPTGYLLGTVSVVDAVPRVATEKQLEMLKNLSEIIIDELELRQTTRNIVRVQTDLMNIAVHDIKNPLTAISLYAKLIGQKSTEEHRSKPWRSKITNASQRILEDLNELLSLAKIDNGAMMLHFEEVSTVELINKAVSRPAGTGRPEAPEDHLAA